MSFSRLVLITDDAAPCSRPPVSCFAGGDEAVRGWVRRRRRVRGRGRGATALQAREALHLHARRQGKWRTTPLVAVLAWYLTLSRIWICLHNVSPCRSSQHFQRDIVRGVEGYIVTGSKQVEIGRQLNSRVSFIEHMNLNFGTVNVMRFLLKR